MSIKINIYGSTEAQASAIYFLEKTHFSTSGHAVVVDIGGGTSDISHWNKRNMLWEDSVKFAGGDLVEVIDDLLKFIAKDSSGNYQYDTYMRRWPYIHKHWNGKMEDFLSKPESTKTLQTICLFYAGICYYVGMHLKREKLNQPLIHLAFAGNGIRFLEIITFGETLSEQTPALTNWINLFREILKAGHGFNKPYNTLFTFSPEPKLEVVLGLVSDRINEYTVKDTKTTKKMLGLDVTWNGKKYGYDEWDPDIKATHLIDSNIDFKIFIDFIKIFKEKTKEYFKNWQVSSLPSEFNDEMKASFFNSLERRGDEELASPLFLEALKSYMMHSYTSSGTFVEVRDQEQPQIIHVKYIGEIESKQVFKQDTISEYFYIEKRGDGWHLFVEENILNKRPSQEYEQLLSKFYDIIKNSDPQRYELVESALMEWDEKEGKGYLKTKGKIRQS